MNSFISSKIASLAPSLTLKVTNRAKAMKAAGEEVYGLAGGEPDMDTPEFVKQAAIQALEEGQTKYTPSAGIPALRQAIADKLRKDNLVGYAPEQIILSCGAKHACFNAIMAVVEEGDEVIIPAPYWVSYPEMVRMAGGTPVIVQTKEENDWKLTPEEFEAAMTPCTKMVVITTPNNPTGSVYTEQELRDLGEIALSEDILILADEIYENLVYGDAKHVSMASLSNDLYNLTITINGFSKGYSMTGWRLGYSAAPKEIAQAINIIQDHTTSNATSFAQYGALAALQGDQSFVSDMRDEYDMRRQYVLSRLKNIPNISVREPEGAFYFFVNIEKLGLTSMNACDKLLERYKVAAIPGVAFGNDGCLRLSYCTTLDVLKEGLDRFEEFCRAH